MQSQELCCLATSTISSLEYFIPDESNLSLQKVEPHETVVDVTLMYS